jgi:hypothetical protein
MAIEIVLFIVMLLVLVILLYILNIRFSSMLPEEKGQKIIFNVVLFAFGIGVINVLLSVFVDTFLLNGVLYFLKEVRLFCRINVEVLITRNLHIIR